MTSLSWLLSLLSDSTATLLIVLGRFICPYHNDNPTPPWGFPSVSQLGINHKGKLRFCCNSSWFTNNVLLDRTPRAMGTEFWESKGWQVSMALFLCLNPQPSDRVQLWKNPHDVSLPQSLSWLSCSLHHKQALLECPFRLPLPPERRKLLLPLIGFLSCPAPSVGLHPWPSELSSLLTSPFVHISPPLVVQCAGLSGVPLYWAWNPLLSYSWSNCYSFRSRDLGALM